MRNLITFFAKNSLWVNSLIFIILLAGVVSTIQVNRSFFPEKKPSELIISVTFKQESTAIDIEQRFTSKIEKELRKVLGVEYFSSTTSAKKVKIKVRLSSVKNIEKKRQEVESLIKSINLPDNKQSVTIRKRLEPVVDLVLFGGLGLDELRRKSDKIERDLYGSDLIKYVDLSGNPYKEVLVELSKLNLIKYDLTIKDISNKISQDNVDISSGTLKTDENNYSIKSIGKKVDLESLRKLPLKSLKDGTILRLGAIASIREDFLEVESFYNSDRCVTFSVKKNSDEDIIAITDWVYNYVERYNKKNRSSKIDIVRDQSVQIRGGINILSKNGLFGLVLVILVLGVFLNFKTSIWVAFGIPLSFFGMMVFLNFMGYTINQMSMFGMIVVVGILVDDGIVIGENICFHIEQGKKGIQAAIDGTLDVLPSVFSSVATTIVAFAALFFIDGNVGQVITELAFVVIVSLAFSLVEASLILPNHLKHVKIKNDTGLKKKINQKIEKLRDVYYANILNRLIKHRWFWAFGSLLFLGGVLLLLISVKEIEFSRFPHIEANNIELSVVLKKGVSKEKTQKTLDYINTKVEKLSNELYDNDEKVILSTNTFLGTSKLGDGSNAAMISIQLNSKRVSTNAQIIKAIRKKVGILVEAEKYSIGVEQFFGKPLSIYLSGNNGNQLKLFKKELIDTLRTFSELEDVFSDEKSSQTILNISLKEKAYFMGLTKQQIMTQVEDEMNGEMAQYLRDDLGQVPLKIRLEKSERDNLSDLMNTMIMVKGNMIPLDELVDISVDDTPSTIKHYNGRRRIRIEANQVNNDQPIAKLMDDIESNILPKINEKYPDVSLNKGGQQKEDEKFNASAITTSIVLVPIIILMIALSLKSIAQAILILIMLIPSIFGSLIGHAIESTVVVTMSYVGFISLVGIVVNDAIVFADRFNGLLKQGLLFTEALVEAGKSRFRAIMLTSITTIAGLYPLVFEKSVHANFLRPMAISVAYGVLFGTVFILLFFPLMIAMVNDMRKYLFKINRYIKYLLVSIWDGNTIIHDSHIPSKEELEPAIKRNYNTEE